MSIKNIYAILCNSLQIRGCGLGYLVYGERKSDNTVVENLSMDSLKFAIPRNLHKLRVDIWVLGYWRSL